MIYTAHCAAIIHQVCGLNKKEGDSVAISFFVGDSEPIFALSFAILDCSAYFRANPTFFASEK